MRLPGGLRVHPRLDRARRGRPDAPAGRAARDLRAMPGPGGHPPGGRQRDRRRVADLALDPHGRADRAGADSSEGPALLARRPLGPSRGGVRPRRRLRHRARGHRVGGAPGAGRPRPTRRSRNISARVVSMPSWELFDEQPTDYHDEVLPPPLPRLGDRSRPRAGMVPLRRRRLSVDSFGASAPAADLFERSGSPRARSHMRAEALLRRGASPAAGALVRAEP